MRRIIASLDVGSNTIKLVILELYKKNINVLAVNEIPSAGIKKGIVINQDLAYEAITELFSRTEKMLDISITEVVMNVVSNDLDTSIVSGEIIVPDLENPVITKDLITKVLAKSTEYRVSDNRMIVNLSPIKFRVDDMDTSNPIGLSGTKLSVKAVLNTVPKKNFYGIYNVLNKIGIKIVDYSVSGAADYYTYHNDSMDNQCGVIINIGSDVTNVSIINKGIITANSVLDMGGSNIDSDIAYVYNITRSDGKLIKEKLGLAISNNASISETYNLTNKNDELITVNQKECSLVIESRLKEILEYSKKQINHLTKKQISYIIITGGVSELKEFDLLIENIFGSEVILGNIPIMGVRNNKYSTCVGLAKYYDYKLKLRKEEYSAFDDDDLKNLTHHGRSNKVFNKLFGYFFEN